MVTDATPCRTRMGGLLYIHTLVLRNKQSMSYGITMPSSTHRHETPQVLSLCSAAQPLGPVALIAAMALFPPSFLTPAGYPGNSASHWQPVVRNVTPFLTVFIFFPLPFAPPPCVSVE